VFSAVGGFMTRQSSTSESLGVFHSGSSVSQYFLRKFRCEITASMNGM
jgi:hypothetical protein